MYNKHNYRAQRLTVDATGVREISLIQSHFRHQTTQVAKLQIILTEFVPVLESSSCTRLSITIDARMQVRQFRAANDTQCNGSLRGRRNDGGAKGNGPQSSEHV